MGCFLLPFITRGRIQIRPCEQPLLCKLATRELELRRNPAAGGRERLWRRRHKCACYAGTGTGARDRSFVAALTSLAVVGAIGSGSRSCDGRFCRILEIEFRSGSGRCRLDACKPGAARLPAGVWWSRATLRMRSTRSLKARSQARADAVESTRKQFHVFPVSGPGIAAPRNGPGDLRF